MTYLPSRVLCRIRPQRPAPILSTNAAEPWFSDGSFINYAKFLTHAPAWCAIRDEAIGHREALEVLRRILTVDPADTFRSYAPQYDSLLNATVVQILRMAGWKAPGDARG